MKELSIEEKAQRYDKALEKARQLCAYPTTNPFISDLQDLFPELSESEDERIREVLIKYFTLSDDNVDFQCCGVPYKEIVAWLEKQAEQKSNSGLDIEIPFGAKDSELQEVSYHIPEGFHAEIENNKVIIKKGGQKPTGFNIGDEITVNGRVCRVVAVDKDAWSEEDKDYYDAIITKLEVTQDDALLTDNQMKFLISLKDRVQPQPKQEWSEEDKNMLKFILTDYRTRGAKEDSDIITWLKSLRPQNTWKPSDEQIGVIEAIINNRSFQRRYLDSLYADLKKLKG